MKIVVIGGTGLIGSGLIGSRVVRKLTRQARTNPVRRLVRPREREELAA